MYANVKQMGTILGTWEESRSTQRERIHCGISQVREIPQAIAITLHNS